MASSLVSAGALAAAHEASRLQSRILDVTAESVDEVREFLIAGRFPIAQVVTNILVAAEYRPKSVTVLASLIGSLSGADEVLVELSEIANSLSAEQVSFLSVCIASSTNAQLIGKSEAIAEIFKRKAGDIDISIADHERDILGDDVDGLGRFCASPDFSVDARVRPSLLFGSHLVRDQPTLAQFAAFFGAAGCFGLLAARGANLGLRDDRGRTLAQFAVAGGHGEIVAAARSAGCDFSGTMRIAVRFHRNGFAAGEVFADDEALPLLHQCAASNNVGMLLHCLERGSDVRRVDAAGSAALHVAARFGAIDVLALLLGCERVDANTTTTASQETALHVVASLGFVDCATLLLGDARVDRRASDSRGRMALHVAAECGSLGVLRALLADGAVTVNSRTDYGGTALHAAVAGGDLAMVRAVLAVPGVDVGAKTLAEETAVHCAARTGNAGALALLREAGGDVNAQDRDGWTALHDSLGSPDTFAIVLGWPGVDVNCRSMSGWTPLHKAASAGAVDSVAGLLAHGAIRVNEQDDGGWTALHAASKAGSVAVIKRLLAAPGIDVNARDGSGWTPLHGAVKYQHHAAIDALLAAPGIDVNARTGVGWTPLHVACLNHDEDAVARLAAHPGVATDARDNDGRTPQDLQALPVFGGLDICAPRPGRAGGSAWDRLGAPPDYFND